MRWFKVFFSSFFLFFNFSLKAHNSQTINQLLDELEEYKLSIPRGGKIAQELKQSLLKEKRELDEILFFRKSVVVFEACEFILGEKKLGLNGTVYKNNILWVLAYLYEKNPNFQKAIQHSKNSLVLFGLLEFFLTNKTKNKGKLEESLVKKLHTLSLPEEKVHSHYKVLVKLLGESLKKSHTDAVKLASSLIRFLNNLLLRETKSADFMVEAGMTRALGRAHTHPRQKIRQLARTFLENLQLHTSNKVSDLDQQKTDWKHFWDKIKIDLGLKEKKPELHLIQFKNS